MDSYEKAELILDRIERHILIPTYLQDDVVKEIIDTLIMIEVKEKERKYVKKNHSQRG